MDAVCWFAFRGQELLVRIEERTAILPGAEEWEALGLSTEEPHLVGELRGSAAYAVGLDPEMPLPEGMVLLGLRKLWGRLDEEAWKLAGRAVQIVEWDRNHRFCGRCGTPTAAQSSERSRTCPSCGLQHFPRLSPAVITLVEDDEGRALLARSPHFAPGVYSTIAGFVEPGESLEEAVAREVREEVGVELDGIAYLGSWTNDYPYRGVTYPVVDLVFRATAVDPSPGRRSSALPQRISRPMITNSAASGSSHQRVVRIRAERLLMALTSCPGRRTRTRQRRVVRSLRAPGRAPVGSHGMR